MANLSAYKKASQTPNKSRHIDSARMRNHIMQRCLRRTLEDLDKKWQARRGQLLVENTAIKRSLQDFRTETNKNAKGIIVPMGLSEEERNLMMLTRAVHTSKSISLKEFDQKIQNFKNGRQNARWEYKRQCANPSYSVDKSSFDKNLFKRHPPYLDMHKFELPANSRRVGRSDFPEDSPRENKKQFELLNELKDIFKAVARRNKARPLTGHPSLGRSVSSPAPSLMPLRKTPRIGTAHF